MDPSHFQRTPSSRSRLRERAIVSSPVHSSHLSSHGAESAFVPMFLDSSPPPYTDDSGYAEFWPDPYHDCEPTRVPFYPQSANTNQRHSHVSSVGGRAVSLSPTILSRSSSLGTLPQFTTLSRTPSRGSSHPSASPSHLELPPIVEAQFISDMPSPTFTPEPVEPMQLSPSDTSGFSWSELASHSSLGSPDVPQASFSLSPPRLVDAEEGVHYDECPPDARYISTERSVGSSQDSSDSVDDAPEDIACPSAEEGTVQWDYVCLEDVLVGLFEDADPWNALSQLLGLPSSPVGPSGAIEDILAILGTSDRRGVGYTLPGSPPDSASFPTSQTLEEAYREDSASWDFASIVSPIGPPLSGGYGHPSARHRAREAEAEFVGSHMAESIPPLGSYAPPRCSADSRSPSPQPTDRHETVIQLNQTVESPKASGNGGDFASEAVAGRRSRCIAFHFEMDDDLGLVDGPSLFDDEDPWCSEG
ncbi:hypothetical protein LXA43DRAFT_410073 [Ganoderma leucocontextum]|nr:hypothetical protein LXA43DRAFT_410073 [Ganoderma leucocontextum]